MLELRPAVSEDDYDSPVGLDREGVVYRRRKARKRGLGYDMYHETVPYKKVRRICVSRQSSAKRVLSGIGMSLVGIVIMAITVIAFMGGYILFGLLIILAPFLLWEGVRTILRPNGIGILIDSEGEKEYTITLELREWRSKQDDIAALLREAEVHVETLLPDACREE